MKRIHLFEIEDQSWFPNWLRICMTRLIVVMHRLLKTKHEISSLIAPMMKETGNTQIIDLCSGSGGPMPDVLEELKTKHGLSDIQLSLSDLYPNDKAVQKFATDGNNQINYIPEPVDATSLGPEIKGLRTIICGFHHMRPAVAKEILTEAHRSKQPICIYEISDNNAPAISLLISLPLTFIMCFFITFLVRPISWQQLVFTFIIPIIPLAFAWDGSVSNLRTYTHKDMDELLEGLKTDDYRWEMGATKGNPKKLYLLGMPLSQ